MREIKFRVWHSKAKEMLFGSNQSIFRWEAEMQPIHIMQYTGLKENAYETGNKEIYQGDIIEFINGERLFVEWNDDTCKFQYSDGSDINDGNRYGCHKMIVGNIYENSQLIQNK